MYIMFVYINMKVYIVQITEPIELKLLAERLSHNQKVQFQFNLICLNYTYIYHIICYH